MNENNNQYLDLINDKRIPDDERTYSSSYEIDEAKRIQRLADVLNQSPPQKISLGLTIAWLFGGGWPFLIFLEFVAFLVPIVTISNTLEIENFHFWKWNILFHFFDWSAYTFFWAFWGVILLKLFFRVVLVAGLMLILSHFIYSLIASFRALRMFKTARFSVSYRHRGAYYYFDESGNVQQRKFSFFSERFNAPGLDNRDDSFCLAILDRKNPKQNVFINVSHMITSYKHSFFELSEWVIFDLPIRYDISNRTLKSSSLYVGRLLLLLFTLVIFGLIMGLIDLIK